MPVGHEFTVLRMVQRIMSRLGLHNISTLGESEEDAQILELLNSQYEELITDFPWAHRSEFVNLEVTIDENIMRLPNQVVSFDWIKYDHKPLIYVDPEFMHRLIKDGPKDDRAPTYWTTLDQEHIIFDAYPTSLESNKAVIYAKTVPNVFFDSDNDKLGLPPVLNNLLLNMTLRWAAEEINGDTTAARDYERKERRLRIAARRWARRHNKVPTTFGPDYARSRPYSRRRVIESSNIIEGS